MSDPYYGGYRNPAIGQAAANLASMFAPPSGAEVYGFTRAAGEKQKQERLKQVWDLASRPGVTPEQLDALGIGAGLFNPSQSAWSVRVQDDTNRFKINTESGDRRYNTDSVAKTTMRGQDLDSADRRYNTDTVAKTTDADSRRQSSDRRYKVDMDTSTSLANNQADNKTRTAVALLNPLSKDQVQYVEPGLADMFPGVQPGVRTGVIAAQPGETNYVPDGKGGTTQLNGTPKPPTMDEVKAKAFAALPPEAQAAAAAGDLRIEDVIMGDGTKTPMTQVQRLAAKAPVASKEPAQVFNYVSPDGQRAGTAIMRDGKLYDSQTNVELPQGVRVQGPNAAQGKDGAIGPTTANQTVANNKEAQINEFEAALTGYETLVRNNPGAVGIPGAIRGAAQNAVSVVQEFSAAFGNTPLDAVITPEQARQLAATVGAQDRDPAIQQARVYEADLAYKWAQLQNPQGEVSRQAFERGLDVVAGGTLRNNQTALESIAAMREVAKRARLVPQSLRNPGGSGGPAQAAPQAADTLPPEVAGRLKEGVVTTFGNGQSWTLQGGKPTLVK